MFGGGGHYGTAGQEGLEIQPDMAFSGSLAPAMFGPVQRAGHQLDGGRIHDVDEAFETEPDYTRFNSFGVRLGVRNPIVGHAPTIAIHFSGGLLNKDKFCVAGCAIKA
jgi:hypothetical protein